MDINVAVRILNEIKTNIKKKIVGKDDVIDKVLICLVAGGHALIEDVPGLGKTTLISALADSINCSFKRIQFTPDVLPSDITGFNMFNIHNGEQVFHEGAISCQILLADEINRTSPKTQSALLQAMQEGEVTVDDKTIILKKPFSVFATQNPIEMTGTYPLPEAQLDRFLLRISIGYPAVSDEVNILNENKNFTYSKLEPVCSSDDITEIQSTLDKVRSVDEIKRYIVLIAGATRNESKIALGLSPRGSLAVLRASMGKALLSGRDFVIPDDVKYVIPSVIPHRIKLQPTENTEKNAANKIIADILSHIPVPGA